MSKKNWGCSGGSNNAVYGLGLIGALFYFLQNAANFSEGLIGVFKSFVWPAYFVYHIFQQWGL